MFILFTGTGSYYIGVLIPDSLGACVNETCAGYLIGDDGQEIDTTIISVDNSADRICFEYFQGQIIAAACLVKRFFVCQYDPADLAGNSKIVWPHYL